MSLFIRNDDNNVMAVMSVKENVQEHLSLSSRRVLEGAESAAEAVSEDKGQKSEEAYLQLSSWLPSTGVFLKTIPELYSFCF